MAHPKWLFIAFLFLIFSADGFGQEEVVVDTVAARIYLDSAKILSDSSKFKEALALNKKALNIYIASVGELDTLTAKAYNLLSKAYYNIKQLDSSIEAASQGMEISLKLLGKDNIIEAFSCHRLSRAWQKKGDYYKALAYGEITLKIWIQTFGKNHEKVADAYSNIGIVWTKKEEFDKALKSYDTALEIKIRKLGENHLDVAEIYHVLGSLWSDKGNYEKSLKYYEKSLEIKVRKLGENHISIAKTYNNLGILWREKGDFNKAIKFYKKASEIFIEAYGEDHIYVAFTQNNIGNVLKSKRDLEKALIYFEKALRIKIKSFGESHPSVASTYNNIGEVWREKGDFDKALSYYKKALTISIQVSGKENLGVALAYHNIGNAWLEKRNYEKAIMFYEKALAIRVQILGENNTYVASTYNNIGVTWRRKGDFDKALMYLEKALVIKMATLGEDSPELAINYSHQANTWKDKGDFDKALMYYEKVLTLGTQSYGSNHPFIAQTNNNIGLVWEHKGNTALAYSFYNNALENLHYNFDHPTSFSSVSDLGELQSVFLSLKESYKKRFQESKNSAYLDSLNSHYQVMIALEDFIQKEYSSFSTRQFYTTQSIPIYEEAISNLFIRNHPNDFPKAFILAEKTKSRFLVEKIKSESSAINFGLPDSLRTKEHMLNVDIAYLEKNKFREEYETKTPNDSLLNNYMNKIFTLREQRNQLLHFFKDTFPNYYNLRYSQNVISISEIQTNLFQNKKDRSKSILEYMVGDSSIFIFLVQKDTFEIHEIKHDFPLDDWVREMTKDGISGYYATPQNKRNPKLEESTISNYTNAAQQLYNKLIAPIADKLTEDLIIIPDGVLGYVPFEALLITAPPREGAFRTYPYLLKKHQISYCYSATLLQEMQQKQHRRKPSEQLLAMAPFFQDDVEEMIANLDTTDLLESLSLRDSLNTLRGSGEEIARINDLWKGTSVYGTEASLAIFQQQSAEYQIIHLSTHGKVDDRVSDYAYLAFGVPYEKGTFDKLYARDLYNYSLNSDMVVLSACETGIGELQKGEGIVSLARAFAYAGSKSVFSTLWKVNDEKTKNLMVYFYKNLKKGKTKDAALRKAKLKYLKKNKGNGEAMHPFFWAGLIGIGDMSAISSEKQTPSRLRTQ
jgi:CHAT domain-containing protein/Tfp pilus assembly protein PilF